MSTQAERKQKAEAALAVEQARVARAKAGLAVVIDSAKAMTPDSSDDAFDGIAQALVAARARLEVAQLRLASADGAWQAVSTETTE